MSERIKLYIVGAMLGFGFGTVFGIYLCKDFYGFG